MSFSNFYVVFLFAITAISTVVLVNNTSIFYRTLYVPMSFEVTVTNVTYTIQQSDVRIRTEMLLQNPSDFELEIDYIGQSVSLNAVPLTDPQYPPHLGAQGARVTILGPKSNQSVKMEYSLSSANFPLDALEKIWFFRINVIIHYVPLLGQVRITRYCEYAGVDA